MKCLSLQVFIVIVRVTFKGGEGSLLSVLLLVLQLLMVSFCFAGFFPQQKVECRWQESKFVHMGECYVPSSVVTFRFFVLSNHFPSVSPCSGVPWMQKTHLLKTQSSKALPYKSGTGPHIAIHAMPTARDFSLAHFCPSGPFTCIISETSPE